MPSSDGPDSNATIEKPRRSLTARFKRQPGAPIARAPIGEVDPLAAYRRSIGEAALALDDDPHAPGGRRSRAFTEAADELAARRSDRQLTVVDGDAGDEEVDTGVTIDPSTASTLGDFAAAMVGPVAAALFARSLAVFIGTALFVLLIRSQGRRSALTDSEISAVSPAAAALGGAVLTFAVVPGAGAVHALSAGLAALLAGAGAALILRAIVDRFVHTRVAVLGDAALAHDLAWQLSSAGQRRFTIVGYVTRTSERDNLRDLEHVSFKVRRLGLLSDLSHIVARNDIDLLVMAAHDDRMKYFERAAVCTERFHTRLLSLTAFEEAVFRRVPLDHLNVAWFQHIMHPRFRPAPRLVTRSVDILFALALGLLTLPLWAPTALFMRVTFGRPVLVARRRTGERGRAITLYRFRVARRDVTGGQPSEETAAVGFGKFLRRTRIERIPQLLTLLRGEITLVGPRALTPQDLADRERDIPFYGRRNMLRPGLTGWAQLHGPAEPEREFSSDLFYLKHQSLMLYTYVLLAAAVRPIASGRRRQATATTSN